MYATTNATPSAQPTRNPDRAGMQLRARLSAVYSTRAHALRDLARPRVRNGAEAWDAVQDAFLQVLEHPPADTSERALAAALESAVRAACSRQARVHADDLSLRIALRKRSPV